MPWWPRARKVPWTPGASVEGATRGPLSNASVAAVQQGCLIEQLRFYDGLAVVQLQRPCSLGLQPLSSEASTLILGEAGPVTLLS